jgi:hypothetical protein
MNIPLWQEALINTGLFEELEDVLFGFQYGFHQGVPHHTIPGLDWFTPPNHSSSLKAEEKIRENFKKEIAAGRMFGPFSHSQVNSKFSFFRSSPLGVVVNGDGSIRAINDLSFPHEGEIKSINSYVDKEEFATTWDDFKLFSSFFRKFKGEVELALFDWEKAYRQIPTSMDQWPYMFVLDFNGNLLLDTRITFGGVAGCGSFGRPADAWKKIMLAEFELVTVFRWVDDNLFVRRKGCQTDMNDIATRAIELGILTKATKYKPFEDKQKFIGFIWNGVNKTVRLPDDKLAERIRQIEEFFQIGSMFSYNNIEIIVGRLNHVSYVVPQLRCYLCSLYCMLKSWVNTSATRCIDENTLSDLKCWHSTLMSFNPLRMIPSAEPTDVGWYGDASTSFGIGILINGRWGQWKWKGSGKGLV